MLVSSMIQISIRHLGIEPQINQSDDNVKTKCELLNDYELKKLFLLFTHETILCGHEIGKYKSDYRDFSHQILKNN